MGKERGKGEENRQKEKSWQKSEISRHYKIAGRLADFPFSDGSDIPLTQKPTSFNVKKVHDFFIDFTPHSSNAATSIPVKQKPLMFTEYIQPHGKDRPNLTLNILYRADITYY